MLRRGALVAVLLLLLVGTSPYQRIPHTPVIATPAVAQAAEANLRDNLPGGLRLPGTGPNAVAPRVVISARTTSKVVALTFDLDMTPQMAAAARAGAVWLNQDAVAYLESQHVHATLFMTGMWAEVYPRLAQALAGNPDFEVGNHSYSHPAFHTPCYRLDGASREEQVRQIQVSQKAIERATGVLPRYFRFPGGCYDRQALDLVHAAGLIPVGWNVNSIDAFNSYPQQIVSTVLSQVEPGSIVVMHLHGRANAPSTGQALRLLVPELRKRGYQFVTVSELLALGPAVQPSDPREVSEFYLPPPPLPPRAPLATPRWCGWVYAPHGRAWACR